MDVASREEKEAILEMKLEQIRQKNAALERRHKEIEADRLRAMKTGSLIDPKQVTTSPSVRHSRNMNGDDDKSPDSNFDKGSSRDRRSREWDLHDNRDQGPPETIEKTNRDYRNRDTRNNQEENWDDGPANKPVNERPVRDRRSWNNVDNRDYVSGETNRNRPKRDSRPKSWANNHDFQEAEDSNRERPNRDRNRGPPNRGPRTSPRANQENTGDPESPREMQGVKDPDERKSKYSAAGRGKRRPNVNSSAPEEHAAGRGAPYSPRASDSTSPRNNAADTRGAKPVGRGGNAQPPAPRSSSPPPDPNFNFLADRSRSGPLPDSARRGREQIMRHPRNYGGPSMDQVKEKMSAEKQKNRRGRGRGGSMDLSLQMTGRERREYQQWKAEREQIDQARIERQRNEQGEWKREWDMEKDESFEESAESPTSPRTEPGRRPAGRIGSGRFDRGESDPARGTGVPTSPEQGVTEPQFKYQENREPGDQLSECSEESDLLEERGRGRQRGGRGPGRGGSRGGRGGYDNRGRDIHDVQPGDRRRITTQINVEENRNVESRQDILVVKIDNDFAAKYRGKGPRAEGRGKRRSPHSSESSSSGSYTATPVKPTINMVVADPGSEEGQESQRPQPQRRIGSGRLANGRSNRHTDARRRGAARRHIEPAEADDDDGEWVDVEEDGDVFYKHKGQPIPLAELDMDDIHDMHNSSAESLDRFIRENTLHIDDETGLAAPLQHEDLLSSDDESIPETPEYLCKPVVPGWGVEVDLHNSSMESEASDPYMMDDAFGSHDPAMGDGFLAFDMDDLGTSHTPTNEAADDISEPSESSTVADLKLTSEDKAASVSPGPGDQPKQAEKSGEDSGGADSTDGTTESKTVPTVCVSEEDQPAATDAVPSEDPTTREVELGLTEDPDSAKDTAPDCSLSDHSALSADASSTSLTSDFVDASESQPPADGAAPAQEEDKFEDAADSMDTESQAAGSPATKPEENTAASATDSATDTPATPQDSTDTATSSDSVTAPTDSTDAQTDSPKDTADVPLDSSEDTAEVPSHSAKNTAEVPSHSAKDTAEVPSDSAKDTAEVPSDSAKDTAEVPSDSAKDTADVASHSGTATDSLPQVSDSGSAECPPADDSEQADPSTTSDPTETPDNSAAATDLKTGPQDVQQTVTEGGVNEETTSSATEAKEE